MSEHKTDELRTIQLDSLITPSELAKQFPISPYVANHVTSARKRIEKILTGEDKRLLVIIGPCSIHDFDATLDYAKRLNKLRIHYQNSLEIVMRTYFEKPRTVVGWEGLISDPYLDGSYKINDGLKLSRKILLAINQLELPTATEFLGTILGQYIADLISWGAIGARTTESQMHRQMASALSCPVGFKNGTDGNIQIAIDAIHAARAGHPFISPDKNGQLTIYQTKGNPYGHIIMRGGKIPNYYSHDIAAACEKLRLSGLSEHIIIDFSHANCQKLHHQQFDVAEDICQQLCQGSMSIVGVMAESFLIAGTQKVLMGQPLTYGQSITDPCLNWEESERLLAILATAVNNRF